MDTHPTIIFISKTCLRDELIIDINIPGYSLMHNPTPTRATGVGIYVKSNLNIKQTTSYNLNLLGHKDRS